MNNHQKDSFLETTWTGYLRADQRKGVRNLVLVIYTVECASFVAQKIAENEPNTQVIGFSGCYGNDYAIRLLLALGRHPNVGAVLCVGLGCEYLQPAKLAQVIRESGRPSESFFIQDEGGTASSISKGKQIVKQFRQSIDADVKRVSMSIADLVIGSECGGSDATSGLAGNPVVGKFFDILIDHGGTAIFEEVVEMIGLKDLLVSRGKSQTVKTQLAATYDKAMAYCQSVQQYSASPGNFAGGLTTIEEKSMGAFAKSGSREIQGVIKVSEQPARAGLWLLDSVPDDHFMQFGYTNPNDSEGLMDLISAGAQIILFITGRGSVIGSPIAPLIKITGNRQTFEKMTGDMDFNAGPVLEGKQSLKESAQNLARLVTQIASGQLTKPETLGHQEYCVPYKYQTHAQEPGCRV
ncbi:D-galactarate dehydratase [candidate division KSB1 bacterium]|nr:D-galactarate dehydratase [candidate division KSB1 bacterium]